MVHKRKPRTPSRVTQVHLLVTVEFVETTQEQRSEMVGSGPRDGLRAGDAVRDNRRRVGTKDEFGRGRCEGWQTGDGEILMIQSRVL